MPKNTIISLLIFVCYSISGENLEINSRDHSLKKFLKWPFENVIQPFFSTLLFPIYPPLLYVDSNEVIDRMIDLSTWGPESRYTTFPLVNVFGNTDSYLGYKHYVKDAFSLPKSKLSNSYRYYIDGDYSIQVGLSKYFADVPWGFNLKKNSFVDVLNYIPVLSPQYIYKTAIHSDSSLYTNFNISIPFRNRWVISYEIGLNQIKFKSPLLEKNQNPLLNQYLQKRGYYSNYLEIPLHISLVKNTKETEFTSTNGCQYGLKMTFAYEEGFGNYFAVGGGVQNYTLLGKTQYSISKKEDRERLRKFMKFKLEHALPFSELENWQESLLNRKVLVTTMKFRQVFDAQNQPTVLQALSTLGTSTPLRAYTGSRFLSYGNLSYGNEYRWPIIRKVDGVVFNEYGVYFNDPSRLSEWSLKNSWGYGIRFTNPDLYFLRLQIAFHGFNGFGILLTTSSEFN